MPIGWGCITSSKYEQKATLLRQGYASDAPILNADDILTVPPGTEFPGGMEITQHPVTGQPIREWLEAQVPVPGVEDNPDTEEREDLQAFVFKCQARGIITGGLNSQGTTERWTSKGTYENVDFITLQVPRDIIITRRDRVTNITNSRGEIVWREEDHGKYTPTVFDVRGVTPSLDPFGALVEWYVLLERAEIQSISGREGGTSG